MSVTCTKTLEFHDEIETLIAEIDACLPACGDASDREHELQQAVYRERRTQARSLFRMMASHSNRRWAHMDGDAHRAREALKLSREFFRRVL